MHRSFHRQPLKVRALPIIDLRTGGVIAREYILSTTESANVNTDILLAAALNEGRLIQMDLDYFRIRLTEAETSDLLPSHFSLFPDTLLSERSDELIGPLLRFCKHRQARLSLNASMIPPDVHLLSGKLQQLASTGVQLEVTEIGGSRGALDMVVDLRPKFARLSATVLDDIDQTSRFRQLRRTVGLLRALGATVIADGVDTEEQRGRVLELGVYHGAGDIAFSDVF